MLLDLFLIGLVVTLEPIPLTGMILVLATEGGLLKGLGYVLGWLLTLVGIVALTVLVTGGKPLIPNSNPSTAALAVKLADRRGAGLDRLPALGLVADGQAEGAAAVDGGHRPHQPVDGGRARLPAAAMGAGDGRRGHHHAGKDLEHGAVGRPLRLLPLVLGEPPRHGDLRRAAARHVKSKLAALLQWITSHRDQVIVFLSLGLGLYLMAKSIYGLVSGD